MSVIQSLVELERIRRRIAISVLTESGISYGAFMALDHMDRYQLTRATDIARSVDISNATIVTLVQRMEHDGLIRRAPDPEDGRASVVRMTDVGRSRLNRGRMVMDRLEAMMTEEIDPDLITVIGSVAKRISRNLSEASHRQIRDLVILDSLDWTGQDPHEGARASEGLPTGLTVPGHLRGVLEDSEHITSPSPQGAVDAREHLKRLENSFYQALAFHPQFSLSQIRLILRVRENQKPTPMRHLVEDLGYDYQKTAGLCAILSEGRGDQEGRGLLKRVRGKDRVEKLICVANKGYQLCDVLASAFPGTESPFVILRQISDKIAETSPKMRLSSAVIFLRLAINDGTDREARSNAKSLFKDRAVIDLNRHLKNLNEDGLVDFREDVLTTEKSLPTLTARGRSLFSDLKVLTLQMGSDQRRETDAWNTSEPVPSPSALDF